MKKKLTIYAILLISLLVFLIAIISYQKNYSVYKSRVQEDLKKQALLLSDLIKDTGNLEQMDKYSEHYSKTLKVRITIIDNKGKVMIDTEEDPSQMENHLNRLEVKKAIETGYGTQTRFSHTLKLEYLYVAVGIDNPILPNGIIRLSVPLSDIQTLGAEIMKLSLIGIVIGALFVIILFYIYINRLTEPLDDLSEAAITISKGNYNIPLIVNGDEQINRLADAFEEMRLQLKRNISKVERRNNELELILKSIVNGMVSLDKNKEVMFHNERFCKLFDIENKNIVDKTIYELVRNSSLYALIDEVFEKNEIVSGNIEYVGNTNKVYRITANPMCIQNKTIGALLIIQDITNIVKLENMRRDFVSNVTHELKTPLTSIRGFVDTLKAGAIQDESVALRFLDIIDIEAERLNGLIQDILSLSEIENSNKDSSRQSINVAELAQEVLILLKQKAQDKSIELDDHIEEVPSFMCNPNRIKQLLINLLDNAIKYTEKGQVELKIYKRQENLMIQVRDTGIGIPKAALDRIFERFYRVDKGRSRKMGGTGLGLSIVKHIVELYDGEINVESKIEDGTLFTVQLPYQN